jgi:hypothetical protein
MAFLESLSGLSRHQQQIVAAVIQLASEGTAPAGWVRFARTSGNHWMEVERSVFAAR